MSAVLEAPFSDLLNRPRDTLEAMRRASARSLRLRRRDAEDLVLTTLTRYEQDHQVIVATTRLIVVLVRHDDLGRSLLLEALPEVFPWVRFLPGDEMQLFLRELVATLRSVEDLDNLAPVAQVITEWRHTADVHADPELAAVLSRNGDDFGPVPEPRLGA